VRNFYRFNLQVLYLQSIIIKSLNLIIFSCALLFKDSMYTNLTIINALCLTQNCWTRRPIGLWLRGWLWEFQNVFANNSCATELQSVLSYFVHIFWHGTFNWKISCSLIVRALSVILCTRKRKDTTFSEPVFKKLKIFSKIMCRGFLQNVDFSCTDFQEICNYSLTLGLQRLHWF
jgi:hypothetical protein